MPGDGGVFLQRHRAMESTPWQPIVDCFATILTVAQNFFGDDLASCRNSSIFCYIMQCPIHIFVMGEIRDSEFGAYVNHSNSRLPITNRPENGMVRVTCPISEFLHPMKYLWNGKSWRHHIYCTDCPWEVLTLEWPTIPRVGVVRATWPIFRILHSPKYSGMAEAWVVKFCAGVGYLGCQPWDN